MPYEMLNNIIDIYKYIYVMDVYNREAFSNLHISCVYMIVSFGYKKNVLLNYLCCNLNE